MKVEPSAVDEGAEKRPPPAPAATSRKAEPAALETVARSGRASPARSPAATPAGARGRATAGVPGSPGLVHSGTTSATMRPRKVKAVASGSLKRHTAEALLPASPFFASVPYEKSPRALETPDTAGAELHASRPEGTSCRISAWAFRRHEET